MDKFIDVAGNVSAVLGILLCVASGIARIASIWEILDFGTVAVFNVGVGLMVFSCWAKLHSLGRSK